MEYRIAAQEVGVGNGRLRFPCHRRSCFQLPKIGRKPCNIQIIVLSFRSHANRCPVQIFLHNLRDSGCQFGNLQSVGHSRKNFFCIIIRYGNPFQKAFLQSFLDGVSLHGHSAFRKEVFFNLLTFIIVIGKGSLDSDRCSGRHQRQINVHAAIFVQFRTADRLSKTDTL